MDQVPIASRELRGARVSIVHGPAGIIVQLEAPFNSFSIVTI
jgi:hypothetical protein